ISKGFFHGHTYSANPLACTAAIAGIELLTSAEIQADIARVIKSNTEFASEIRNHNKVKNVRQLGVILAFELDVEMERYGNMRNLLFQYFMDRGVFLRPLGNTIYILPPFNIEPGQLQKIYTTIEDALEKF